MLKQYDSELLSAYMDNELSGDELIQVQESLSKFIEWREELEKLQKTKTMAMALPRLSAPPDFVDSLALEANKYVRRKRFNIRNLLRIPQSFNMWSWGGGSLATAMALLIFVGVQHVHQNAFIPLEPLLTAHARSQGDSLFHQNVLTASVYSAQLKNHAQN